MKMRRLAWPFLFAASAPVAVAAPTAAELAARMLEARLSPGFEARVQAVNVAPDGQRSEPVKLAIIGQSDATRRRLLLRGIAPETVRGELRLAEYRAGCLHAVDGQGAADPFAPLFNTSLVAWDMLSPWWDWPRQSLAGNDRVAGRACTLVRSRNDDKDAPIREVLSCVDANAGLSLRTQLFDGKGALVRSVAVVATMRKESGLLAAKKVAIAAGDKLSEAETYSGDEHYEVPADAFAKLEGQAAACR
jgi:negative regulator of sigma E activity